MAEAFSAIGNIIGTIGKVFTNPSGGVNIGNIAKAGTTGLGLIGDIIGQQKQNASLNNVLKYQNNPALAEQTIQSLTAPLSQGLTQEVGNSVQGYLGERGLAQSPNITASVLAQALAPYVQQNQQMAASTFGQLINPAGAKFSQPADLASLLKLWNPATPVNPNAGAGVTPPAGGTPPFVPQGTDSFTDSPIDPMAVYS